MHEVYDLLVAIDPSLTHNKMATMVGLSTKSTKRIFGDGAPTSTVGHMLLIIKDELGRLKTKQENVSFIHSYKIILNVKLKLVATMLIKY